MNLTDLYKKQEREELEKQAHTDELLKVAQEWDTAGRIRAHGYYDEMTKIAGKAEIMKYLAGLGSKAKDLASKGYAYAKSAPGKVKKAYSKDTLSKQYGDVKEAIKEMRRNKPTINKGLFRKGVKGAKSLAVKGAVPVAATGAGIYGGAKLFGKKKEK